MSEQARKRLIFALDTADAAEAFRWVDLLGGRVGMFKVGKEAFTSFGPDLVKGIKDRGGEVFLDLKFHDIPNTVAGAALAAGRLGVRMFNVHALGGVEMMRRAASAVTDLGGPSGKPIVLAVTVLTSLADADLNELGYRHSAGELALNLAKLARGAGIDGVVASAWEVPAIRAACGRDFIIVTPGIRLPGEAAKISADDQKRVLTPGEAISNGADYLVVGRPIRTAADPGAAADLIVDQISKALKDRK